MYASLESDIFSVFGSSEWTAENINTYPANFVGSDSEFIRVNIIPSGVGVNKTSKSGVLIIDIYTPAGMGTKRSSLIADTLDKYLANKSLKTITDSVTQFNDSALAVLGPDPDDGSLFASQYTIPFNFYGV